MVDPKLKKAMDKVLETHSDLFTRLAEQEEKEKLMLAESTKPVTDVPNEVVESPTPEAPVIPNNPEMQAAQFIMVKLPVFRGMVDRLTGVQAKRVLNRLIESPLEEETEKFTTVEAAECFMLGMHIQNAKHVLFLASIKAPDAEKVVDTALAEEQAKNNSELTDGENNVQQ